jgi:hypothetical protein
MKDLDTLVRDLIAADRPDWRWNGREVEVCFGDEGVGRRQIVRVARHGDIYRFSSLVLPARQVTRSVREWRLLAVRAWQRNARKSLVAFTFDADDDLIGVIEQPAATLDAEELRFYVDVLARECDRFEYVLTGEDRG